MFALRVSAALLVSALVAHAAEAVSDTDLREAYVTCRNAIKDKHGHPYCSSDSWPLDCTAEEVWPDDKLREPCKAIFAEFNRRVEEVTAAAMAELAKEQAEKRERLLDIAKRIGP